MGKTAAPQGGNAGSELAGKTECCDTHEVNHGDDDSDTNDSGSDSDSDIDDSDSDSFAEPTSSQPPTSPVLTSKPVAAVSSYHDGAPPSSLLRALHTSNIIPATSAAVVERSAAGVERSAAIDRGYAGSSYHESSPSPTCDSQNVGGGGGGGGSGDGGLTAMNVASTAFSCVAQCMTEGYRAASNYYGGSHNGTDGLPGAMGGYGGDHSGGGGYYNDVPGNDGTNGGSYQGAGSSNGSYQTVSHSPDGGNMANAAMGSQEAGPQQKNTASNVAENNGGFASVALPSTYQGGEGVGLPKNGASKKEKKANRKRAGERDKLVSS